jgi:hypothetical protein
MGSEAASLETGIWNAFHSSVCCHTTTNIYTKSCVSTPRCIWIVRGCIRSAVRARKSYQTHRYEDIDLLRSFTLILSHFPSSYRQRRIIRLNSMLSTSAPKATNEELRCVTTTSTSFTTLTTTPKDGETSQEAVAESRDLEKGTGRWSALATQERRLASRWLCDTPTKSRGGWGGWLADDISTSSMVPTLILQAFATG